MKLIYFLTITILLLTDISSAKTNEEKIREIHQLTEDLHQYIMDSAPSFARMNELHKGELATFQIEILSLDEMQRKFKGNTTGDTSDTWAVYDVETKTMYFHDEFDFSTLKAKSYVLHEYIHFLQFEYGMDKDLACPRQIEHDSYRLQIKYLTDNGVDKNSDLIHVLIIRRGLHGTCRPDHMYS